MLPALPRLLSRGHAALLLAGGLAVASLTAAEPAPGPWTQEFPVATVTALLRPAVTRRVAAPAAGPFHLVAAAGPLAAGAVIGTFDDTELRAALETARLRLQAARQQAEDYAAEAPARRQEAQARLTDLEGRLALAEAVAKDPALLRDLPPAVQAPLQHADPAGLRAQLEAARARLAQLDVPGRDDAAPVRLQVREAEQAVRAAETALRAATVIAPIAGQFQPAPELAGVPAEAVVGAGQELGTIRDLSRLVATVPAFSPYLLRLDLTHTRLRLAGPGGEPFDAPYQGAVTEPTPVMGETRLLLYEFSAAASRALADLAQTNAPVHILLVTAEPVAVVAKLPAALAHPDAFRAGWADGVVRVWPGWVLVCEGETVLGCRRAPEAR